MTEGTLSGTRLHSARCHWTAAGVFSRLFFRSLSSAFSCRPSPRRRSTFSIYAALEALLDLVSRLDLPCISPSISPSISTGSPHVPFICNHICNHISPGAR